MISKTPFLNLFGNSPFTPLQQHIEKAHACAELLVKFFAAAIANDWQLGERLQQEIADLERQADHLKKDIRLHLPKSLFLPVPRQDLLELVTAQDHIANSAKDIAGVMLGRQMRIPAALNEQITEYVLGAVATSEQARKAINEMDELLETGFRGHEAQLVEKMIAELDRLEHETDINEMNIRKSLFAIEKDLPPIDVMFLYQVIDGIGDLADRAQRVGSRLSLLLAH